MVNKSYFSIKELCASDTASKYKISNTPDATITKHLNELINFLNPIREAWGSAIQVTSGFRCKRLNDMVGGSKTSAHLIGYAADIYPKNGDFEKFKKFISDYLLTKSFDQCIIEKSGKSQWIHLGLFNNKNQQRKMIFNITK